MFKLTTALTTGALAMSLGVAATAAATPTPPAADPADARALCSNPQKVAEFFGAHGQRARFEGAPSRRTIYLPDASYAVQRCRADGTLRTATLYELRQLTPNRNAHVPTMRLQASADGTITGGVTDYISPNDPRAPKLWDTAAEAGPLSEAPARRSALTRAAPLTKPRGRANPRTYPPTHPRCFNGSYNTSYGISMWPNRGLTYYTNLPNASWDSLVEGGRTTIDDRWNECGNVVTWRTGSTWGGVWPGLNINLGDGVSAVTIGASAQVSSYCGGSASTILACISWALTPVASTGPGGQTQRITEFDMLFNGDQPFTSGALPGFYDVWSVAAHEWGHAYGLGHVSGGSYDDWLLMYPYTFANDTKQRYNSLGDLLGIGQLYP